MDIFTQFQSRSEKIQREIQGKDQEMTGEQKSDLRGVGEGRGMATGQML